MTKRDYDEHLRVFRAIAADIRRGGMTTQSLSRYEPDTMRGGDIDHVSTLLRNGLIRSDSTPSSTGRELRPVAVRLTPRGEKYLEERSSYRAVGRRLRGIGVKR